MAKIIDTKNWRSIHFSLSNLKRNIAISANLMRKHAKKMDNWGGSIQPTLDFNKEADLLEKFPAVLSEFLNLNNYMFDEKRLSDFDDTLEIGFGGIGDVSGFDVKYILLNKIGFASPLRIGFDRFINKEPVNIPRTMAYVFYLERIVKEARKKKLIHWIEFTQKYTFPVPYIRPSDTTDLDNKKLDLLQAKLANAFNIESATSQTKLELEKKLNIINKKQLIAARKRIEDFVGDALLKQIPNLIDKIEDLPLGLDSIEELYGSVLNKTDISELASIGVSALAAKMPSADVDHSIITSLLEEMCDDQLLKIYNGLAKPIKDKIISEIKNLETDETCVDFEKPSVSISGVDTKCNSFIDATELGLSVDFMSPSISSCTLKLAFGSLEGPDMKALQNSIKNVDLDFEEKFNDIVAGVGESAIGVGGGLTNIDDNMGGFSEVENISSFPTAGAKTPSVPSFTIPDTFKVDDTMPEIISELTEALDESISGALKDTTLLTLKGVYDSIFSNTVNSTEAKTGLNPTHQYGVKNLNTMLTPGKRVEESFEEVGIPAIAKSSYDNESDTSSTKSILEVTIKDLIDDISAILTPIEMVHLLEGNGTKEVLKTIKSFVAEKYPGYKKYLSNTVTISNVFKNVGKYVPKHTRQSIKKEAGQSPKAMTGLLCEDDFNFGNHTKGLLTGRLSEECISHQIKKTRKRNRQNLKKLLNLIKDPNNFLEKAIPPVISSCADDDADISSGINFGGLIPKDHQTIKYMNKKITKNMFDIPNMYFNMETLTYLDSLLKNEFTPPVSGDAQFEGLKTALKNAGGELQETIKDQLDKPISSKSWTLDTIIAAGGNNNFPGSKKNPMLQAQYNAIAAPYQRLALQVAPNVQNTFLFPDISLMGNIDTQPGHAMAVNYKEYQQADLQFVDDVNKAKKDWDNTKFALMKLEQKLAAFKLHHTDEPAPINWIQQVADLEATVSEKKNVYNELAAGIKASEENTNISLLNQTARIIYYDRKASGGLPGSLMGVLPNNYVLEMDEKCAAAFSVTKTENDIFIEGSQEPPPLEETSTYSFGASSNGSLLEESFANFILRRWLDVGDEYNIDLSFLVSSSELATSFRDLYKSKQGKIFSSLLNNFATIVGESSLFEKSNLDNLELASSRHNPDISACFPGEKPKPGLLDTDNLQKIVNDLYDEACENINREPSEASALEKSGLQGNVYATVRLHVIEVIFKSIFTFSQFPVASAVGDNLLVEFVAKAVVLKLKQYGGDYYNRVAEQAKIITDMREQKGEKLVDPLDDNVSGEDGDFCDTDVDSPPRIVTVSDARLSSLRFLVKEQISLLSGEIDRRVKPNIKNLNSFFIGVGSLNENNFIPTIDVAKTRQHNRFEVLSTSKTDFNKNRTHYLKNEYDFLDANTNAGAGGFIIEKYIRIKDKEGRVDVGDQNKAFGEIWDNRPGGILKKFVQSYSEDTYVENFWGMQEHPLFTEVGGSPDTTMFGSGHLSGVVNVEALVAFFNKHAQAGIDMKDFVDEFKFGLRLCYIPPAHGAQTMVSGAGKKVYAGANVELSETKLGEIKLLASQNAKAYAAKKDSASFYSWLAADEDEAKNTFDMIKEVKETHDKLEEISIIEKAYWLQEHYEFIAKNPESKKTVLLKIGKRDIYSIPLISTEIDLMAASSELRIGQELEGLLKPTTMNKAFKNLKKKMKKTPEYKFLFNYIFSLPRIISLLAIYNNLSTAKNIENVEKMFDMTKESLKSVFYTLTPEDPWYSKQDEKHAALGHNPGMMEQDNSTVTIDGPARSPSYAKISYNASVLLLKDQARRLDPNYKAMYALDEKGRTPAGMTWDSLPILWPSNMMIPGTQLVSPPGIPGWGPPLGPIGSAAYSAKLLAGEKKSKKKRKAAKANSAAKVAAGNKIKCED